MPHCCATSPLLGCLQNTRTYETKPTAPFLSTLKLFLLVLLADVLPERIGCTLPALLADL
jgi:hypothetical protein